MGAAITEPRDAPAPKIPWAMARSFAGNHSALLFVAPGQHEKEDDHAYRGEIHFE